MMREKARIWLGQKKWAAEVASVWIWVHIFLHKHRIERLTIRNSNEGIGSHVEDEVCCRFSPKLDGKAII